jgi:hypothetical protein
MLGEPQATAFASERAVLPYVRTAVRLYGRTSCRPAGWPSGVTACPAALRPEANRMPGRGGARWRRDVGRARTALRRRLRSRRHGVGLGERGLRPSRTGDAERCHCQDHFRDESGKVLTETRDRRPGRFGRYVWFRMVHARSPFHPARLDARGGPACASLRRRRGEPGSRRPGGDAVPGWADRRPQHPHGARRSPLLRRRRLAGGRRGLLAVPARALRRHRGPRLARGRRCGPDARADAPVGRRVPHPPARRRRLGRHADRALRRRPDRVHRPAARHDRAADGRPARRAHARALAGRAGAHRALPAQPRRRAVVLQRQHQPRLHPHARPRFAGCAAFIQRIGRSTRTANPRSGRRLASSLPP